MKKVHIPVAYYQTPDKRLQTTQDKLFATLKQYFEAGDKFTKVSVSALCRTAKVARQTYYQHYDSISEIIEVAVAQVLNQSLQKGGSGC
ncbi:TetR family transcriptional regulator [Secundilactobacillus pentosiphilus]|uniref:TetR family transcriptional regulator n=1 Tax=Secundilactobacillus pentosiphilus TaxID=1714682 RepID=A0A1Z5INX9_9LACO|nr:TetR/AcrR family transcriptional regulator [Secundilactobacillus pentosiphilus]GAX03445.1 TetR family transcriptional regulator [Secundilactobacillus pentosiphilus]